MNKIKTVLKNEFVSGKTWFDWAFLAVGLTLQIIAIVVGFVSGEHRPYHLWIGRRCLCGTV